MRSPRVTRRAAALARVSVQQLPTDRRRPSVALLGCLTAIDAIAIDSYVPALPTIQRDFLTNPAAVQWTLSVFLVGIAVGQALWGPVSDRFGRRLPLLLGLLAYVAGSVAGAIAPDLASLVAARLAQALGASAGLVLARAVVGDVWPGHEAARLYSVMMQVLGLTALVSPLMGGALLTAGSWRLVFAAMTVVGTACLLWTLAGLPETHPESARSGPRLAGPFVGYVEPLRDPSFIWATACAALAMAAMFVLIAGSPFIFIGMLGWSNFQFSMFYAVTSVAFVAMCEANNWLLRRMSPYAILSRGLALQLSLMAVWLVAIVMGIAGAGLIAAVVTALMGVLGLTLGNAVAEAMRRAPAAHLGSSSAIIGVAQFVVSAAVTPLATARSDVGLSVALAATACAGLAALASARAHRGAVA